MISLAATSDVAHAMREARNVALCAYSLRWGQVAHALEAAARSGANVEVRLEQHPYGDASGRLARANRRVVTTLRAAGADARLVDRSGAHARHIKAAIVDGVAYLDDRNWPDGAGNTIVRDANPFDVKVVRYAIEGQAAAHRRLVTTKGDALRQEAGILAHALRAREAACVESESFTAGTKPYIALKALARAGVCARLLVAQRDVKPGTMPALRALQRDGVTVRLGGADEKLAIGGDQAWIGSANATYGRPDQIDWGLRVTNEKVAANLRARFESYWARSKPLQASRSRTGSAH